MVERRDLKAFLIEQLEKTGYPLEMYVTGILREKGWETHSSVSFYDRDSRKDRELDIRAEKKIFPENLDLTVYIRLLIQCKKIPGNAWVFFEHTPFSGLPKIITVLDAFGDVDKDCLDHLVTPLFPISNQEGTHYHLGFQSERGGEFIFDKKLSNKRNSNLFEAVVSLIKAVSWETQTCLQDECLVEIIDELQKGKILRWAQAGAPQCIYFVFPLIVFEGKMYSAKFPLAEKNFNEKNYVHVWKEYKSANYNEKLSIDVVEKQFLPTYLTMIENDLNLIKNVLEENGKLFIKDQIKTLTDKFKPGILPK